MIYKRKLQSLIIILAVSVSTFVLCGTSAAMQDAPTTRVSTSASSIIQNDQPRSPEEAARRLYDAWRTRNRRAALKVAGVEAVNQLFQDLSARMEHATTLTKAAGRWKWESTAAYRSAATM